MVAQSCATISPWNSQTALPQAAPAVKQTTIKPMTKTVQRGDASWYGPGFRGKKTASGDSFDQAELTAAHKTFPLGSKAKVTNLKNGNTVEVEITDRGPFVEGRIIDLSKAAAEKLGMIGSGTAPVQVELLSESALR
jgi:rare lipoprotein A